MKESSKKKVMKRKDEKIEEEHKMCSSVWRRCGSERWYRKKEKW